MCTRSKHDRLNRQKQLKQEKRNAVLAQKRLGKRSPPFTPSRHISNVATTLPNLDIMSRTSRIVCLLPLQGGEGTTRMFLSQLQQLPHAHLSPP
ncbi:hypothetical protein EON64_19825, partial [archaeon]